MEGFMLMLMQFRALLVFAILICHRILSRNQEDEISRDYLDQKDKICWNSLPTEDISVVYFTILAMKHRCPSLGLLDDLTCDAVFDESAQDRCVCGVYLGIYAVLRRRCFV